MTLKPKHSIDQLRALRAAESRRENARSTALGEEAELRKFAESGDDIGVALATMSIYCTWQSRVELDDYLFNGIPDDERLPPDFQICRIAFVEILTQCRDWLQFGGEAGPDMAAVGGCIVDLLAIGQAENARILHDASIEVLGRTGYSWQNFWKDRKGTEPDIPDEDIPTQKLVPYAHELFAAQAGTEIIWDDLFMKPDLEYVNAAKTVMSQDMKLVKRAINTICDLHITYSSSNPEGDAGTLDGFEIDGWDHILWPSTVFAYLRVRQTHRLDLPQLDHPLLTQPMGQFPARPFLTQQVPEWFLKALERLKDLDPSLSDLRIMMKTENR